MPLFAAADAPGTYSLHGIDAAVVVFYLLAIMGLGVWVGRGQKSSSEYFLGDRSLPLGAILLSIVATETSTVTFLSLPGLAFAAGGDMTFLQITFGYIIGRIAAAVMLLPLYFRGEWFTAYQVLHHRFGRASRQFASALFLVTRNLSDSLRLYLTAIVLREAVGLNFSACVLVLGAVTIAYTYFGGVKSVIWNDCLQFLVYIAGAIVALSVIVHRLPGGWAELWDFGSATGRFRIFDFTPALETKSMTFWAGVIGGGFLTASTHGIDQLNVQRLLSARDQKSAATALISSGVVILVQFGLFLVIGVALACFYDLNPEGAPVKNDRAFAAFIVNELPVGLVGLTLAAVFAAAMSTLSSSLNSSATALVNDLLPERIYHDVSSHKQLALARAMTILFGLIQVGGAILAYELEASSSVVDSVLKIAAFATGPMLGLYMLAALTPRVKETPALIGFVVGIVVLSWIALTTKIYWPWYAAIGALVTFGYGVLRQWGDEPRLAVRSAANKQSGQL